MTAGVNAVEFGEIFMKVSMVGENIHHQIIPGRKTEALATVMATTEWKVYMIMIRVMN